MKQSTKLWNQSKNFEFKEQYHLLLSFPDVFDSFKETCPHVHQLEIGQNSLPFPIAFRITITTDFFAPVFVIVKNFACIYSMSSSRNCSFLSHSVQYDFIIVKYIIPASIFKVPTGIIIITCFMLTSRVSSKPSSLGFSFAS